MPMAMEHFLPGFALPAGMPMHAPYLNMPVGPYQYPHNAFPAPVSIFTFYWRELKVWNMAWYSISRKSFWTDKVFIH